MIANLGSASHVMILLIVIVIAMPFLISRAINVLAHKTAKKDNVSEAKQKWYVRVPVYVISYILIFTLYIIVSKNIPSASFKSHFYNIFSILFFLILPFNVGFAVLAEAHKQKGNLLKAKQTYHLILASVILVGWIISVLTLSNSL